MLKILPQRILIGLSTPLAVPPEGVEELGRRMHLSREERLGLLLGLPNAHVRVGQRIARMPLEEAKEMVEVALKAGAEPAAAVAAGRLGMPLEDLLGEYGSVKAAIAERWWEKPQGEVEPPPALTAPIAVGMGIWAALSLNQSEAALALGILSAYPIHRAILFLSEWLRGHLLALLFRNGRRERQPTSLPLPPMKEG